MFGLLNSSQIYGLQHETIHEKSNITTNTAATPTSSAHKQRRSSSNVSDTTKEQSKFLATLNSASQGMKSPTNFIEKFIKSELLNGYDTIRNYKNSHQPTTKTHSGGGNGSPHTAGVVSSFNCLHGNYRSSVEGEFYEPINVTGDYDQQHPQQQQNNKKSSMTIKCSADVESTPNQPIQQHHHQQSYLKLSDSEVDQSSSLLNSSGASSGEFNSSDSTSTTTTTHTTAANNYNGLLKKTQNGTTTLPVKNHNSINGNANEIASDNSSSSISTTTNSSTSSSNQTSTKSTDLQRSSSSSNSSVIRERKKSNSFMAMLTHRSSPETAASRSSTPNTAAAGAGDDAESSAGDRSQRRKLMHVISNYDQQNKLLQHELAKEKRRRNEELACVVKSLLCFEGKLKADMKCVNQRLMQKDAEICRLVRQNRALRKQLRKMRDFEGDNAKDEGVEEDGETDGTADAPAVTADAEDCLVPEALQCINCRKQFYDIELKESWTQSCKDVSRNNDDHTTEHGSSSDDTVSSSFYGARRSIRYTSKRTTGTFRDYMRSRSMHIDDDDDDPSSQQGNNSEENNSSSISRNNSHRSYEKINLYSRTIERMHGLKGVDGGQETRSVSRASNKSNSSVKSGSISSSSNSSKSASQVEEDDGIFSPTQDEDFEDDDPEQNYVVTTPRPKEFSEASPKQVYETSTDDWYASASDQEEAATAPKSYGQNAINPVLECVNQILLQQSMEEPLRKGDGDNSSPSVRKSLEISAGSDHTMSNAGAPKTPPPPSLSLNNAGALAGLPRRSSLSGRRSSRSNSHSSDGQPSRNGTLTRKRVHFSTKNSMVHVPRNDDLEHEVDENSSANRAECQSSSLVQYNPMNYFAAHLKSQTPHRVQSTPATPASVIYGPTQREEQLERLDTLNYESIYSNEYEPIGSELNSSNIYVDMELAVKQPGAGNEAKQIPLHKLPPALPPKPANLLKFKKSLQQLDEMPDEHLQQDECAASTTTASEPDYCSISEVNMGGMRSVQIVADVHKPPESEPDLDLEQAPNAAKLEQQVSTSVRNDDTSAETNKTEEIEEILADIPKLPNVAAIIAPKHSPKYRANTQPNDHYLLMSPKVETSTPNKVKVTTASKLSLGESGSLTLSPRSPPESAVAARQHKRKHVPNILAELNKRIYNTGSLPPSSSSTTAMATSTSTKAPLSSPKKAPSSLLNSPVNSQSLPLLQAEFDWYNLDAEYGKSPSSHHHSTSVASSTPDILKVSDNLGGGVSMLEEIHEDHESITASADEYNLDEEFSLTCDRPDLVLGEEQEPIREPPKEVPQLDTTLSSICEGVNSPHVSEGSPQPAPAKIHAKKMKKNLENFEKFIEGSGLCTKTLPSKRKIYFAGPFV